MARVIAPADSRPVNTGELQVVQFLKTRLSSHYTVIPNLELPNYALHNFMEFDMVVVAPHCVYVIEVKNWGQYIDGNDYDWYLNRRFRVKNPNLATSLKCRVLHSLFAHSNSDLSRVWIHGLVVIANDAVTLNLKGNCSKTTFLCNQGLLDFISDPAKVQRHAWQYEYLKKDIVKTILGYGREASRIPKQIAGYEILGSLGQQAGRKEYKARLSALPEAPVRRLTVMRLPMYKKLAQQQEVERKAALECTILERLGPHPHILPIHGFFRWEANKLVEILAYSPTRLSDLLTKRLAIKPGWRFLRQMAEALRLCHDQGVVHGALSPDSFYLFPDNILKLGEFHHCRLAGDASAAVQMEAPDNARNPYLLIALTEEAQSHPFRIDLFALAIIMHKMFCGTVPFSDLSAYETFEPSTICRVSCMPEWAAIVWQRLLGKGPDRYETATELLRDIVYFENKYIKGLPVPVPANKTSEPLLPFTIDHTYSVKEKVLHGPLYHIYRVDHLYLEKPFFFKLLRRSTDFDHLRMVYHDLIIQNLPFRPLWIDRLSNGRIAIIIDYFAGQPVLSYFYDHAELSPLHVVRLFRRMARMVHGLVDKLDKPRLFVVEPGSLLINMRQQACVVDLNFERFVYPLRTSDIRRYLAPDFDAAVSVRPDNKAMIKYANAYALLTLLEDVCQLMRHPVFGSMGARIRKTREGLLARNWRRRIIALFFRLQWLARTNP